MCHLSWCGLGSVDVGNRAAERVFVSRARGVMSKTNRDIAGWVQLERALGKGGQAGDVVVWSMEHVCGTDLGW